MAQLNVSSEIGQLKKVLVHAPDESIGRITPKNAEELLFDDIVHLAQMQKEHEIFTNVLKQFCGDENVIEVGDLIYEAMEQSPEGRDNLINMVSDFEELPTIFKQELIALDNAALARTMITGYCQESETYMFDPIPNFIFTRDIAVMVNDHVVITKANKQARHRENLLTRFMIWRHERFADMKEKGKVINLNMLDEFPPSRRGERVSVEGGDMMILNEDYILIGCSERSTMHGFNSLKDRLLQSGAINNVVMVPIPQDRTYMHIDTVFTQLNTSHMVGYKPIVSEGFNGGFVVVYSKGGMRREYPTIREFLRSEINANMEFIYSGGGLSPYQEREQWTDACNLLTIRPGVALSYDRNIRTEKALEEFGYAILPARTFLSKCKSDPDYAEKLQNTIISLPSGELSRGRGGSHCMSCPILRG